MTADAARLADAGTRLLAELGLAPCEWDFPVPDAALPDDLVAIGGDLAPSTLVTAYSRSLFPMPVGRRKVGWFSPARRGVIPLDGLVVSRSLRRSLRRYEVTWNRRFADVVRACSDPARPHGWISPAIIDAYIELNRLGLAHSVEVFDDDRLVGGLYGIGLSGLFAGESMFHRATDASKVALVRLVERLVATGCSLLDVQWVTPHLASLGAVELGRGEYLGSLVGALEGPATTLTSR